MFLKFNTNEEFNTWHDQVNITLGYPDPNTKTQQYTELLPTRNGEIICPIDQNCPQQLLDNKILYDYDSINQFLLTE